MQQASGSYDGPPTSFRKLVPKNIEQKSRTQILDDITSFIARHKGSLGGWYVGTAADARNQLFAVHGFRKSDVGLIRNAASSSDTASIADLLIGRGMRGSRGEKPSAKSVYIFKLAKHTGPPLP
jgi:hypothetical protein